MIKSAFHQVLYAYLITYLAYRLFYLNNNCDITFLTVFILTYPVNFLCGRKLERPEKTHDFRQSVDRLFSHESIVGIEPTISEEKGALFDDRAIESEAPLMNPFKTDTESLNINVRTCLLSNYFR
jgi:hypothetical protein